MIWLSSWACANCGSAARASGTRSRSGSRPLHRHVRHPWYALSLVLLWTRDMSTALLVSALAITAYFVVGSWLEERKLLARFGPAYGQYMARVPGLVPRPWRRLSREEARQLEGS